MEKYNKDWITKFHEEYEGDYAGDTSSVEIIRLSKKYICKRILDLGAGSGALINQIPNAIGMDLVSKHKRIVKGDISNIPFKDSSFETIFATEIIEHLDNETLNKGIDEIHRILCRGGSVVITVPNNEDLRQNIVLCPRCGAKFHKVGHMQVFDEKRMEIMLKKGGFEIVKIEPLPIGFMATHKYLKHFRYLLELFGFISSSNLFVVAEKIK